LTAFAQEDHTRFKSEASVQTPCSFVKQTTQNVVQQDATNSAGVLATSRSWNTVIPVSALWALLKWLMPLLSGKRTILETRICLCLNPVILLLAVVSRTSGARIS